MSWINKFFGARELSGRELCPKCGSKRVWCKNAAESLSTAGGEEGKAISALLKSGAIKDSSNTMGYMCTKCKVFERTDVR
jgi:DNA-directed RNA polymerase subunit RPC12/RpoP